MRPVLIVAVLIGTPAGSPWAKADRLNGVLVLKGKCGNLLLQGKDRSSDCIGKVANTSYASGRTGFYFTTEDGGVVTFSGMGSQQVNVDENSVISPVDMIIINLGNNNTQSLHAVGTCRYSNPFKGPAPVVCHADTTFGAYDGAFLSDGSEPDVKKF